MPHQKKSKTGQVLVRLVGGPADGATVVAPPCFPCIECGGVICVTGPASGLENYYQPEARSGDWQTAYFLGGWPPRTK